MNNLQEAENIFQQYWEKEEGYIVMPNSIRARTYLEVISKDIPIDAILDNNEALDGTFFKEIPVKHAPRFLSKSKGKILISSRYGEIAEQLKNAGYQENVDFMDMHLFVSLWYWRKREEIYLLDVHIAITTYCSLNCKNCNMFINHYKQKQRRYIDFEEFKENFEALFQSVDYCCKITILGGEPLLNNELPHMLEWLYDRYHEKIGQLIVVTNGTIFPKEELTCVLQKTGTRLSISDYTASVSYADKIEKLEVLLQENQIPFENTSERMWKNFYFPREEQGARFDSVREHMLCCNPVFRGLNDKRFYYCHIVWSAVQAGLLKEAASDYIDLEEICSKSDRKRLLEHDLGFVENEYVSLCKFCGGCGNDNQSIIQAGLQEEAGSRKL